jgi:hypothetical protein
MNLNPIELKFHPMYFSSIQVACNVIQYQGFFFFFLGAPNNAFQLSSLMTIFIKNGGPLRIFFFFFFCGEFLPLDDKRKGLVNLIKEILRILF